MSRSQTAVSRLVRRWLADEGLSMRALSRIMGMTPSRLCDRLNGKTWWTLDDIDQLTDLGILDWSDLPGYGEAVMAGAKR